MNKKKITKIAVLLLTIALCIGIYYLTNLDNSTITNSAKTYIRTTTLQKESLEDSISATGSIESTNTTSVSSNVNAKISELLVEVGDSVEKGDTLILLEQESILSQIADLEEKIVDTTATLQDEYDIALSNKDSAWSIVYAANGTKALLDASYASFTQAANSTLCFQTSYDTLYVQNLNDALAMNLAYGSYETALSNIPDDFSDASYQSLKDISDTYYAEYLDKQTLYDASLVELNEASRLLENAKNQVSYNSLKQSYETAKNNYEVSLNNYQKAESSLTDATNNLNNMNTTALKTINEQLESLYDTLDNHTLLAESSGVITNINAIIGATASSQSLITIHDTTSLQVKINVDESDIKSVVVGMQCRITSDATANEIEGIVSSISPIASSQGQGSTASTFVVIVEVLNGNNGLLIGMNAQVDIILSTVEDIFVVPYDAVETIDDVSYVYKLVSGTNTDAIFEKIEVEVGKSNDYYIEISGDNVEEGIKIKASVITEEATSTTTTDDIRGMNQLPTGEMPRGPGE